MVDLFSVIFFLIISYAFPFLSTKLIQTNLYQLFIFNKLEIYLGSPSTLFEIGFDINEDQNWIFNRECNNTSSTMKIINENIQMTIDSKTYNGKEIEETMFFDSNPDKTVVTTFKVLLPGEQKIHRAVKGAISFPFKCKDERHSIIHQFKQKGHIDHLSFSFIKREYKWEIFFGGISPIYTKDRHHSFCDVIENSSKWACVMSGIIVKNKTKELEYKNDRETSTAYFDTMSHLVFVPKDVFTFLIEEYYADAIQSKVCHVQNTDEGRYLSCRDEYLFKMGNITFILGGFSFEIVFETLFMCADEFCHYLIHENHLSNDWILGSKFFELYNTLFDYEEKKIHFYSLNKFNKAPYKIDIGYMRTGLAIKKFLTGLVIVVNIIGVTILFYIRTVKMIIFQ